VASAFDSLTFSRRAVALAAMLFLAGCNGGTVDRHALTNDKKTLDSIACEGALVADGVARDRTTVFYAREQAEELRIQASNLADALASRKTVPSIERQVRGTARRAARLAGVIQRLHDHPADRTVGADVERTLKQAGDCP
jgi:hypothetical protein